MGLNLEKISLMVLLHLQGLTRETKNNEKEKNNCWTFNLD